MKKIIFLLCVFTGFTAALCAQENFDKMDNRSYAPVSYERNDYARFPGVIKDGRLDFRQYGKTDTIEFSRQLMRVLFDSSRLKYLVLPYNGFDPAVTYHACSIMNNSYESIYNASNPMIELSREDKAIPGKEETAPAWAWVGEYDKKIKGYHHSFVYFPTGEKIAYEPDIANGFSIYNALYNPLNKILFILEKSTKDGETIMHISILKPGATAIQPWAKIPFGYGNVFYPVSSGDKMLLFQSEAIRLINIATGTTAAEYKTGKAAFDSYQLMGKAPNYKILFHDESNQSNQLISLNTETGQFQQLAEKAGPLYFGLYAGDDGKTALAFQDSRGNSINHYRQIQLLSLTNLDIQATAVRKTDLTAYATADSLETLFTKINSVMSSYVRKGVAEMEKKGYRLCFKPDDVRLKSDSILCVVVYFPNNAYYSQEVKVFDNLGNRQIKSLSFNTLKKDDQPYLTYLFDNKLVRAQANLVSEKGFYGKWGDYMLWDVSNNNAVRGYFSRHAVSEVLFFKKKKEADDTNLIAWEMPYTNYVFPPDPPAVKGPAIPAGKKICPHCNGTKYADDLVAASCKHCNGTGKEKCTTCDGRGAMWNVYQRKTEACPKCIAGKMSCRECGGEGKVYQVSSGSKCGRCKGLGYL